MISVELWSAMEFADCWKKIAANNLRIFSTRKAEFFEVQRKIKNAKENSTLKHCSFAGRDELCVTNTENWQDATPCSKNSLTE